MSTPCFRLPNWESKLAGSYNRYSCENSSPTSVLDQLVNSLNKAQAEERLIPWQYVFADYSVTGLDASRQDMFPTKAFWKTPTSGSRRPTSMTSLVLRVTPSNGGSWLLARNGLNKRMIGASDGFDLRQRRLGHQDYDLRPVVTVVH